MTGYLIPYEHYLAKVMYVEANNWNDAYVEFSKFMMIKSVRPGPAVSIYGNPLNMAHGETLSLKDALSVACTAMQENPAENIDLVLPILNWLSTWFKSMEQD